MQVPVPVERSGWHWGTALVSAVIGGAIAAGGLFVSVIPDKPTEVIAERHNTLTVESIQREEKIVLLSLGIQGINEASQSREVLGVELPGSSRTQFVQYNYRAQIGIDGQDVKLIETGDNSYKVVVPRFVFIGHSDETFKVAVEDKGLLSWVTPEIDSLEQVNKILDEDTKKKHILDNEDILRAQAKDFYEGIIKGIEPEAKVEFSFK
ncbi:hypothetical protein CPHO_03710 [Corynebacterium phocae]|uniref:DUF4230 domain-containing protein n=2 Tax=Corynebacterium phocae TaxID=161895 RepID=A0A1L7D6B7_9CORY|nr:hypothetical protein CPHO_03710 [Corynebacterium phocae]KAA8725969.1 hypothetical protein F4V58_03255 [Corynebacterium phocae]